MMLLSQASAALGAQMQGADVRFAAVSTDTRTIKPGDLFIALKGENFDGSKFVADALKAGAVAAVVNKDSGSPARGTQVGTPSQSGDPSAVGMQDTGGSILFVDDTRLALGQLAAHWRKQFDIPLVAITGSNGKTTVKEMLAAILREQTKIDLHGSPLSQRGRVGEGEHAAGDDEGVLATRGNFNNDIGMPLTLLRMNAGHRYAVIEMGMNHAGEIDYLTRIAQPDVALVNNATGAHLQGLGSVEGVARAKGEIFAGLREQGMAVINAEDVHAALWRELAGAHDIIDFALEHAAAVKGDWRSAGYGGELRARTPAGPLQVKLQVPGEHNALNALAATSAALALQVPLGTITKALEGFGGVAGRLQRKPALQGATLIDDTYNANPASVHAALEVLAQAEGKRVFVLGDMGELGDDAAQFHQEIGVAARELGIDRMLALGKLSAVAVREFGSGAEHYASIEALNDALKKELDAQTTVLIKGSRFMKMERVVQFCALHKEEACCSH